MYPPPTSTSSWVRPSTKRCTDATNVECPTPIWKCSVRDTRSSRVSDICPWTLLPRTFLLPTIGCRHETMCIDGIRRILSCHTYIITLHKLADPRVPGVFDASEAGRRYPDVSQRRRILLPTDYRHSASVQRTTLLAGSISY